MGDKWRKYKIGDVAEIVGGGTPSTKEEDNFGGTISWLTPKDLSGYHYRYISHGERNITEKGLSNSSAKLLPAKSVLLTTRAPVGYVAIAKNPVTTNQGFRSLVLRSGFDPEFLYYLLKTNTQYLQNHASGTTFGELSGSTLKSLNFLFPPLPEQKAIASILGALDDKIELNREMNEMLEAMARAIFKSWFVDFDPIPGIGPHKEWQDSPLGRIPKGWRLGKVSDVFEINPSRSIKRGTEYAYVDMASLPTVSARVIDVVYREFTGSGSKFKNGDVLFARITPCLENGKTALLDFLAEGEYGWGSTEFIVLSPKEPLNMWFVYCVARDHEFRNHAIRAMSGTSGRQRVEIGCFNNYSIVVPPAEIAVKFGNIVSVWFKQIKTNDEQSLTLAAIRDALLPKLLSGEIRVKDAERFAEGAV